MTKSKGNWDFIEFGVEWYAWCGYELGNQCTVDYIENKCGRHKLVRYWILNQHKL